MLAKSPKGQYRSEILNPEEMMPKNHFLRIIEKQYSVFGRPSIDLVVLFKIHILKSLFHKDILIRTYENHLYNNLYKWLRLLINKLNFSLFINGMK